MRTGEIGHLKIHTLATALNRASMKLRIESKAVCRLLKNDDSSGASDFQRKLSVVLLFVHLRNMPAVWDNAYWKADARVLSVESFSTAGTVAFVV
jgi:hypothetical protein